MVSTFSLTKSCLTLLRKKNKMSFQLIPNLFMRCSNFFREIKETEENDFTNILFLPKGKGKKKILTRLEVKKILTRGKVNKILARAAKPQGQEFFYLPKGKNFLPPEG